jgi:hypothetical protein
VVLTVGSAGPPLEFASGEGKPPHDAGNSGADEAAQKAAFRLGTDDESCAERR